MVGGIERFKEFFKDFKEQYVLIGGAACDVILEQSDASFRATKDLDLVLIVEALTPEFAKVFWQFVEAGGYRNKCKSNGSPQFYRFDKPDKPGYPYMLELFSKEAFELTEPDSVLTPLHFSDEVSSLSAILLNDVYYNMLLNGRVEMDHLVVLAPEYIIPFKAKAWIDLTEKRQQGMHVDEKDIKKHKNDIARLATILNGDEKPEIPDEVKSDMRLFIDSYTVSPVDLKSIGIRMIANEDIVARLKEVYLEDTNTVM
ncbi:MAG: hypothetical protein PHV18_05730 [Lachnospiraceae bacterium]|nr:hypothetical protein [Lachnospiraceae bacterium]